MIKVLVVDDSALVRKFLTDELNKQPDMQVVGSAIDPYAARDKILKLKPDVLTLDMEMPRMDGLSFLEKLMKHYPMPVVVVSSLTPKNSENALIALHLGAVDVICKPGSSYSTQNISRDIIKAVRAASHAKFSIEKRELYENRKPEFAQTGYSGKELVQTTQKLIAIGASTGGTRAIERVIKDLPIQIPGIVIVQHMPPVFTKTFANRLNAVSNLYVVEAQDGDLVQNGKVLLAPGNYHMQIEKGGAKYYVRVRQGPPVNHHRPSVDVLFNSVAKSAGVNAMGIILTGMGGDGASGMLEMKNAGAYTVAQDEASSVVYGMPKEAKCIGAVDEVMPLDAISDAIMKEVNKNYQLV